MRVLLTLGLLESGTSSALRLSSHPASQKLLPNCFAKIPCYHKRPEPFEAWIHWYSKVSAKTEPQRLPKLGYTGYHLENSHPSYIFNLLDLGALFHFFIQQPWGCVLEPTKAITGFPFEIIQSKFEFCLHPQFTFVSRLKSPFCIQLPRFDSSKILLVKIQAFTLKTPQTNENKVSCEGYFSNPKCLVGTIAQKDYWSFDHVFFKYGLEKIKEVQKLQSNSVQTQRSKISHEKRRNLRNEIAKWREASLHIWPNWKFKDQGNTNDASTPKAKYVSSNFHSTLPVASRCRSVSSKSKMYTWCICKL